MKCFCVMILISLGSFVLLESAESYSIDKQTSKDPGLSSSSPPAKQFPTSDTAPIQVLEAYLDAMKEGELPSVYHLFSRARKFEIKNAARRDARESEPSPTRRHQAIMEFLTQRHSQALLNHNRWNILSIVGDPNPPKGRLWTRLARVKVDSKYYRFTLTRQSDWDGKGDPRDCDGYERCWFIWEIQPDGKGGSGKDGDYLGLPREGLARELPKASIRVMARL
eukprot:CAMPEP_0168199366 /NCGR_PEP_ID=MMETSP0139_2-20121125/22373_1 /TAXON_ID=44445 /ORGANISM="Pseudo-nitzschia australis, Strain 10249 10 AB" /LENGTH=222 /DNA_ID=CAMNT_0008124327 /DNA_START=88 /DNA_END=756 /DNA_ORIENTATION=+